MSDSGKCSGQPDKHRKTFTNILTIMKTKSEDKAIASNNDLGSQAPIV